MSAFEKQGRAVVGEESDSDSDVVSAADSADDSEKADKELDLDDVFEEVMTELQSTKGVFCVRCAAHSLQLVLKDFRKNIPVVNTAVETIDKLVETYEKTPERVVNFSEKQEALGHEGKQLLRIGTTRWNTYIDAWKAALDLKDIIIAIEKGKKKTITKTQWESMEKAILLCDPVGVATDIVQSDAAQSIVLLQKLYDVDARLKELAETAGDMQTNARKAHGIYHRRVGKNFSFIMFELFQFFNPLIDQRASYTDEQREKMLNDATHFAKCMYERWGKKIDNDRFIKQVGQFIRRPDGDREFDGNQLEVYETYWNKKAVGWFDLAEFTIALGGARRLHHKRQGIVGASRRSDAPVERGFSAEARIFRKLRARLSEKSTE
eukprot:gene6932-747_t